MPTCKDYKQMADRVAQIAIASSAPSVAEALMALALDHMRRANGLSRRLADGPPHQLTQQDQYAGYGD
jgi:lactate dehydrogenase-like 2-hydroxyacid dehydrogenase